MSFQVLSIKLQRTDPSVSWGFNIQGGKEFYSPFMIQKVNPNGLADQSSVRPGDYILRIGNTIVENLTHAQARETIIAQGNILELTLQRGSAPKPEDYHFNFEFPQHRLMNPDNIIRAPTASPQVGIQLNNNKALLTQSYNSPMGLYSNQNIADTLVTTMKNESPLSDSTSSLSTSSLLSNSFSPSSLSNTSFSQKPPFPNGISRPRPFRRAETIEPRKLESFKLIENDKENTFKAIPIEQPQVVFRNNRSKSVQFDENKNIKRNSISSGRALLKNIEMEINEDVKKVEEPEPVYEPAIRRPSWTPTKYEIKKQISKITDPGRPSVTQSKSFRLLQATLENGLNENELVFYDKISGKTEVRRCSLDVNMMMEKPKRRLSKLAPFDQESIEENTLENEDNIPKRNSRSVSVTNDLIRSSHLLGNSSYLSQIKPSNSNTFNNQRRHSYIMNIKDPNYLQEAQKLKVIPKPVSTSFNSKPNFSPATPVPQVTQFKPYQQPSQPHYQQPAYQPPVPSHYQQPAYQPPVPSHYQQPAYQPPPVQAPAPAPAYLPRNNPITQPKAPSGPRNFNRHAKGSAIFSQANHGPNQPKCAGCFQIIRGPFITAIGKIWCPNHFVCANPSCGVSLHEIGFVEENGKLYCERDFEQYFAPKCDKCYQTILGECCHALDKNFHPECFVCGKCKQPFGSGNFHIEDGVPYCERDFTALFSVKCAGCQFPIEAGDKFVEALNEKFHVECFTCSKCNAPLNGGFAVKGNKPYCKKHAY